jgi:hypothetical protein
MKTLKQPIEGSMEVGPHDEVVFTMGIHGAEYLADLIQMDCNIHPDEAAQQDAAALMEAVAVVRRRHTLTPWQDSRRDEGLPI